MGAKSVHAPGSSFNLTASTTAPDSVVLHLQCISDRATRVSGNCQAGLRAQALLGAQLL